MSSVQRRGGLSEDGRDLVQGKVRLSPQPCTQVDAVEVLHDDVWRAPVGLVEIDHLDDVGVAQTAGQFGLAAEAGNSLGVDGRLAEEQLDRKAPLQAQVGRLVHHPHPALTDDALDAVGVVQNLADASLRFSHTPFPTCFNWVPTPPQDTETQLKQRQPERGNRKPGKGKG